MTDYTDHYALIILPDGDLSPEGYRFVNGDRRLIDRLLYLGVEGHHHDGAPADENAPTTAPDLTLDTTTGALPGSTRVYYRHSYVDPNGIETVAVEESWVDTPTSVASPAAPDGLTAADTGGALAPGTYMYRLAAYKDFNDLETVPGAPASIQIPHTGATLTNVITIELPALPSGASGFNVYRRAPGEVGYRYLLSVAGAGTSVDDDGSVTPLQDRPPATANTTLSNNSVLVELTEALPVGYLWRLYRTLVADEWSNSLLATIGPADTDYVDTGTNTDVGSPLDLASAPGSPSKILLTGGAEVEGLLPSSMVEGLGTVFVQLSSTGQPGGLAVLNDDARISPENQSGIALVAAARTYR